MPDLRLGNLARRRPAPAASGGAATATARLRRCFDRSSYLLPVILLAGFFAVFLVVFRDRLMPGVPVETAPVLAVRADGDDTAAGSGNGPPGPSAAPAGKGHLLFQATGWVEPEPLPIKATALVSGVVDEVHVLEGQPVTRGALLATLVDDDAELDLREAERNSDVLVARRVAHLANTPAIEAGMVALDKRVEAAAALLADFEDAAKRYLSLTSGSASDRDIRQADLRAAAQRANLAALEAERPELVAKLENQKLAAETIEREIAEAEVAVARARLALDRTRIVSPVDGVVLRLHAAPGEKRMLDSDHLDSSTIAVLYEPDKLQARIDVPLADAGGLTVGQPVELSCELLGDAVLRGTVTRMVGEADLQRNTLQAKVRLHDTDPRLRPEMLVRAKFFEPSGPGVATGGGQVASGGWLRLFAPLPALVERHGASGVVWVVGSDGRAARKAVQTGKDEWDGHVEVRSGLLAGERLVVSGQERLREGTWVRERTR
jgi:RND family efflux transporter MFP subunit